MYKGLIIAALSNVIPFFWCGIALDNNNIIKMNNHYTVLYKLCNI